MLGDSIEFEGWNDSKSRRMVDTIYDTTLNIFAISDEQNIPVNKAADVLAESRLEAIKKIQTTYLGKENNHKFPGSKVRHNKI